MEFFQNKIDDRSITSKDLLFGRVMPFGKYKGGYMYWLVVKHPYYIQWIVNNTKFELTETEKWLWKLTIKELDEAYIRHLDRLIFGLSKEVSKHGYLPETNPHLIIE